MLLKKIYGSVDEKWSTQKSTSNRGLNMNILFYLTFTLLLKCKIQSIILYFVVVKIEAIDINNSKTKGVNKEMDIGFMTDLQKTEGKVKVSETS